MSEQKVAVVTGGSAGIGEATCRALANDGWKVVVTARRLDMCQQIADEIGGVAVRLDVGDRGSVEKLEELERVDLLVNKKPHRGGRGGGGALGGQPARAREHLHDEHHAG